MKRAVLIATRLIALLSFSTVVTVSGCSGPSPQLLIDASVPADLEQLATTVWGRFLDSHPARRECMGDVALRGSWSLDVRAEYQPATATVVVRIPGTPATLSDAIVHEFAHHVEFTCGSHAELRSSFLEAQGMPPSADWFGGTTWEAIPSEQYAEATVQLVLGRRSLHGQIRLSADAVEVVRSWATGN